MPGGSLYRKVRLPSGNLAVYRVPGLPLKYRTTEAIVRGGMLHATHFEHDGWMIKMIQGFVHADAKSIAVFDNLPTVGEGKDGG